MAPRYMTMCDQIAAEGTLVQMLDSALEPEAMQETLEHLHACSDCLLLLAQVLEMHGQMIVDHYWNTVRGLDPMISQ